MTRYNRTESETLHPTPPQPKGGAKSKDAQDKQSPSVPLITKGEARQRRGIFGSPPRRSAAPAAGWVLPCFLRDRRAAGTALTAALFTLICLAGIAFASDHVWLVYQRDLLKNATDAASIAATKAMTPLAPSLTKAQIEKVLHPIAKRYILANIPEGDRERVKDTLKVRVKPNRKAGTVGVSATADLGGALLGSWLWGTVVSETTVGSKTERVQSIIEVALALDITHSMNGKEKGDAKTRLEVVKGAALDLVTILAADAGDSVAVGLVPWHYRVKFDLAMRQRWEDNGWAQYPTRRYYPNPYRVTTSQPSAYADPHKTTSTGEWHNLPPKPEAWQGCVDQRQTAGWSPPGLNAALPKTKPLTMGFYSPTLSDPVGAFPIAFACRAACSGDHCENGRQYACFDTTASEGRKYKPQFNCPAASEIMPLTTDLDVIKQHITGMKTIPSGLRDRTYSALGVVWGHRLLAPAWHSIWGDPKHPVDLRQYPAAQKALVLLTDGKDNHHHLAQSHFLTACRLAKNAGIKVFVVTAMKDGSRNIPERCSSQADDPSGQYSFVNQPTAEDLQNAFRSIAQQLRRFRRVS